MSGFDLVPVDGGAPVHLPPGETVLGRGPLLGVSDKRVSRHHGLLENLGGRLHIKPTHLNPCFIRSSLSNDPRPLQKGSWYPLHHGDILSLLPGQFIYKVVAVGGAGRTPRQIFEEEREELPCSPEPHVEPHRGRTTPHEASTGTALSEEEEEEEEEGKEVDNGSDTSLNQRDSASAMEAEDDQGGVAPSTMKRRVLPAWMMAAAAAPHALPSSPKVPPTAKRSKKPVGASTGAKVAAAQQAMPTAASSLEGAGLNEEEERPRKRRRKMADKDEEARSKTAESSHQQDDVPPEEPTVWYRSSEPHDVLAEVDEDISGSGRGGERLKNGQQATKSAELAPTPSKSGLRTPCPYGKDCYRKNPVHFQECSHPGDTDYEEEGEEEEEEADRPECPYGTDCYRKNPLHRREYTHTKKPARASRAIAKKRLAADEDEDEDLGDDNSFINDDSEDGAGDSDYVPPDSDDSGREDVRRLQKEARVFLRRRK